MVFLVVEDAAQCPMATCKGRLLGSIGHIGCMSFHGTKSFTAGGQGSADFVNDPAPFDQADTGYDNGANRRAFVRDEVPSYERKSLGSNFIPPEPQTACLRAQLDQAERVIARRLVNWNTYLRELRPLVRSVGGFGRRCSIRRQTRHSVNHHECFYSFDVALRLRETGYG
jgi:dTDP-4-amino-4,6-dideoxygalactose transaminase